MSPVIVLTCIVFANGCTLNAIAYVTSPGWRVSPGAGGIAKRGADAARVHERDLGAAEVARRRREQLAVGDHLADRLLAGSVRAAGAAVTGAEQVGSRYGR